MTQELDKYLTYAAIILPIIAAFVGIIARGPEAVFNFLRLTMKIKMAILGRRRKFLQKEIDRFLRREFLVRKLRENLDDLVLYLAKLLLERFGWIFIAWSFIVFIPTSILGIYYFISTAIFILVVFLIIGRTLDELLYLLYYELRMSVSANSIKEVRKRLLSSNKKVPAEMLREIVKERYIQLFHLYVYSTIGWRKKPNVDSIREFVESTIRLEFDVDVSIENFDYSQIFDEFKKIHNAANNAYTIGLESIDIR